MFDNFKKRGELCFEHMSNINGETSKSALYSKGNLCFKLYLKWLQIDTQNKFRSLQNGCVWKWGYPQIIYFNNRMFMNFPLL